jgi:hypothetical protein
MLSGGTICGCAHVQNPRFCVQSRPHITHRGFGRSICSINVVSISYLYIYYMYFSLCLAFFASCFGQLWGQPVIAQFSLAMRVSFLIAPRPSSCVPVQCSKMFIDKIPILIFWMTQFSPSDAAGWPQNGQNGWPNSGTSGKGGLGPAPCGPGGPGGAWPDSGLMWCGWFGDLVQVKCYIMLCIFIFFI